MADKSDTDVFTYFLLGGIIGMAVGTMVTTKVYTHPNFLSSDAITVCKELKVTVGDCLMMVEEELLEDVSRDYKRGLRE